MFPADHANQGALPARDHRNTGPHIPDVDARLATYLYRVWARDEVDPMPQRCEVGDLSGLTYWAPDKPATTPASIGAGADGSALPAGRRPIGTWHAAAPAVVTDGRAGGISAVTLSGSAPGAPAPVLLPIRSRFVDRDGRLEPDDRFKVRTILGQDEQATPPGNLTPDWDKQVRCVVPGELALGMPGLVVNATEETSAEALFFPAGNILIAHHLKERPGKKSTWVFDIDGHSLHKRLKAQLHTTWRVKALLGKGPKPDASGSVPPSFTPPPPIPTGLCLNLDASGNGDDGYGLMVHSPYKPSGGPGEPP